jgi:hypothetical protein
MRRRLRVDTPQQRYSAACLTVIRATLVFCIVASGAPDFSRKQLFNLLVSAWNHSFNMPLWHTL